MCCLRGSWKIGASWIVIHMKIFKWLEEWPFDDISIRVFIGTRRFVWSESWEFYVEGAGCFCGIVFDFSFEFIKYHINCCFKFCFFCFNLGAEFISITNFIKKFAIGCCKRRECILLGIYFWQKLGRIFFDLFGIIWYKKCSWFDVFQLVSEPLWLFEVLIYQLYQIFQLKKNGVECSVKVIFWYKWFMRGWNCCGFSIYGKILSGAVMRVCGWIHSEE